MNVFLHSDTVLDAYNNLTTKKIENSSVLFTWLILKYAGVNTLTFTNPDNDLFKKKLLEATTILSYLFNDDSKQKIKNNFLNPFSMDSWGKEPTESIYTWSRNRLINNVSGGGRHWKEVLLFDEKNPDSMKLKGDYLKKLKSAEKIPLPSLIIWANKLIPFEEKITYTELQNKFIKDFNITTEEFTSLFETRGIIPIKYDENPINMELIRKKIEAKENNHIWNSEEINIINKDDSSTINNLKFTYKDARRTQKMLKTSEIIKYLNQTKQIIFTGPPATSKSFVASEIAKEFDIVKTIQFHPQYSYQEFIGGSTLKDGTLKYEKGILLDLIIEAQNNKGKEFLLLIDEINRANISQVFGELIQLLDRNSTVEIKDCSYQLPENLKILGTMNSSDRTLGRIDYAIKRRFPQIYFSSNPTELSELCTFENNEISLEDFLTIINANLVKHLKNKELVIGHALFFKDYVYNEKTKTFDWNYEQLNNLFNYYLLPIIEEYCNFNDELIASVLGNTLPQITYGESFKEALLELMYDYE